MTTSSVKLTSYFRKTSIGIQNCEWNWNTLYWGFWVSELEIICHGVTILSFVSVSVALTTMLLNPSSVKLICPFRKILSWNWNTLYWGCGWVSEKESVVVRQFSRLWAFPPPSPLPLLYCYYCWCRNSLFNLVIRHITFAHREYLRNFCGNLDST